MTIPECKKSCPAYDNCVLENIGFGSKTCKIVLTKGIYRRKHKNMANKKDEL